MDIDYREMCLYGAVGVALLPSVIQVACNLYGRITKTLEDAEREVGLVARENPKNNLSAKL
jgi:hypothetical protein